MSAITSRYARAFADVIFEHKLPASGIAESLQAIGSLITSNPALREVWQNPSISSQEKRAVLDAIAKKTSMPGPLRNFIAILIDHGRVAQVPEVAAQFQVELNQRLGIEDADVTSARELGLEERRELEQKIAGVTGKKINAHYATDPRLLGGAVVRMGSTIYDGSVRGRLRKLKEELAQA